MLFQKSRSPTRLSGARLKRLFARTLFIVTASTLIASCSSLTKPLPEGPSPLVIASCPELTPLTDATFGATTTKLVEVAGQYRECRCAALAGRQSNDYNECAVPVDR